jgi:hypothetical protein
MTPATPTLRGTSSLISDRAKEAEASAERTPAYREVSLAAIDIDLTTGLSRRRSPRQRYVVWALAALATFAISVPAFIYILYWREPMVVVTPLPVPVDDNIPAPSPPEPSAPVEVPVATTPPPEPPPSSNSRTTSEPISTRIKNLREVKSKADKQDKIDAKNTSEEATKETGFLTLDTVPWTVVYLNGKRLGETPIVHKVVPVGSLELTLVNTESGLKESYVAHVKPGAEYKARLDLKE